MESIKINQGEKAYKIISIMPSPNMSCRSSLRIRIIFRNRTGTLQFLQPVGNSVLIYRDSVPFTGMKDRPFTCLMTVVCMLLRRIQVNCRKNHTYRHQRNC